MPNSVVPDPEFQPAVDLASKRAGRYVEEKVGLAEREASALIASMPSHSTAEIHRVVTVAFLKGWVDGYGEIAARLDEIAARYEQGRGS